uniref:Uncharacterized protein n=1 Tax=Oryza punctata TaxID=4537 RepID=A0A0E0LDT0_ORYPU
MAEQLRHRVIVFTLLFVACLVLATTTVADARLLKRTERDGDAVESPAVDFQAIVGSTEGDGDGAGDGGLQWLKSVSLDMLGAIKDSGPSPGAGH